MYIVTTIYCIAQKRLWPCMYIYIYFYLGTNACVLNGSAIVTLPCVEYTVVSCVEPSEADVGTNFVASTVPNGAICTSAGS